MSAPDAIAPEAGLPLAALLWGLLALPHVVRYLRDRHSARKETCARLPTPVQS